MRDRSPQAQVRYTQRLRDGQSLAFAAERPITEARAITDGNVAFGRQGQEHPRRC